MSNRKTIKINPDLFKTGGKKSSSSNPKRKVHNKTLRKKERKKKPNVNIKPGILRRALFERIKERKKKERFDKETNINSNSIVNDSEDLFKETFNSLLEFEKQKKEEKLLRKQEKNQMKNEKRENMREYRKNHNKTLKHHNNTNENVANFFVETELPTSLKTNELIGPNNIKTPNNPIQLKARPPYGCLKNGKTPTYRQWMRSNNNINNHNKTFKNSHEQRNKIVLPNKFANELNREKTDREKILERIRREIQSKKNEIEKKEKFEAFQKKYNRIMNPHQGQNTTDSSGNILNHGKKVKKFKKHIKTIRKKTIKRKYKLGKQIDKNKVSVLIKNKKTRKKIQHEEKLLKRIHIMEIKNQLISMGLLKHGSVAPNNVIRKMYESAILSGEIKNVSKDVLIHNYMKT